MSIHLTGSKLKNKTGHIKLPMPVKTVNSYIWSLAKSREGDFDLYNVQKLYRLLQVMPSNIFTNTVNDNHHFF
jgi:hypothetical protein